MNLHKNLPFIVLVSTLTLALLSCATRGSGGSANSPGSLVPSTLTEEQRKDFREIAREVANPCKDGSPGRFSTLDELLENGKTCRNAYILSHDIVFFLSSGANKTFIRDTVQTEAQSMTSPIRFKLEKRPRLGNADAPVEIVVFGNYQCPHCARASRALKKLHETRPEDVSIVFKHSPSLNEISLGAAYFSAYAHSKGRFWEVHDRFYGESTRLGLDTLQSVAEELGMYEDSSFDINSKDNEYLQIVSEDLADALEANIVATPALYVNGVSIGAIADPRYLMSRIDAEMSAPPQ